MTNKMAKKLNISNPGFNEILLYTTPNGKVKIEIYLQNETVWLTQQKIAELFCVQRPAITKHLKNIFELGELVEEVVSSKMELTTRHGANNKYARQMAAVNICDFDQLTENLSKTKHNNYEN
jgi:hypothetical protein